MTKTEAIKRAEAARHAAKLALARHAMIVSAFGESDKLAQAAMLDHDVAIEAHNKWMDIAHLHPKRRDNLIRKKAIPAWMFSYTE